MSYFKTCNEGTSNTPQTCHDSSPSCIRDLTSPWSQMHSIRSSGSAPNWPDFPIFDGAIQSGGIRIAINIVFLCSTLFTLLGKITPCISRAKPEQSALVAQSKKTYA